MMDMTEYDYKKIAEEIVKINNINKAPFIVTCSKCGSSNVSVIAFEFHDLEIKCEDCDNYLDGGVYNSNKYRGDS